MKNVVIVVFIVSFFLWMFAACVGSYSNRIIIDDAVDRFKELARTEGVVVIRHSNPSYIFGDPHDVVFELMVDGTPVSGRCTSGEFSPMVCRLYTGGE